MSVKKSSKDDKLFFVIWPQGTDPNIWEASSYKTEAEAIEAAENMIEENNEAGEVMFVGSSTHKVKLVAKTEKI